MAAGTGTRFGGSKQYGELGGRRVLDWSLETARATCDRVVRVVPATRVGDAEAAADAVVTGGETRSASVRAGLAAVPDEASVIAVHDAARPLATPELWRSVLAAAIADDADGAIPVVPVRDTLRRTTGGTVDRDGLVAVQTPQAFRAGILRRAHRAGGDATDDATLVEAAGGRIALVAGEPANLKITTRDDLAMVEALCR